MIILPRPLRSGRCPRPDRPAPVATRPVPLGAAVAGLVAGFVGVAGVVGTPRPVGATNDGTETVEVVDCVSTVLDTSGLVDIGRVQAAADAIDLSRIGSEAKVVVRVWDEVPDADLMAAVDELVVECYGDPQGGIADGVAVLGLAVGDGLSDVLLGGGWVAALPDANQLRTDVMGPPLGEGDITGGLVAALEEMAARVAELPDPGLAGVEAEAEADPPPVEEPSEEEEGDDAGTDSGGEGGDRIGSEAAAEAEADGDSSGGTTGGGRSPLAIAGAVAGLGACGGGYALLQRRRRLIRERDRLRRRVEPTRARLRLLRERHRRLLDQADGWNRTSAGRTRTDLVGRVRAAERAAAATDRAAGLLHQSIPGGVDEADLDAIRRSDELVAELARTVSGHTVVLDDLSALGAHLDHLEIAIPAKAELLAHELPAASTKADERATDRWDVTEARVGLAEIGGVVVEVREAAEALEVDLLDLSDRIEAAEAALFAIVHDLERLPDRRPSLQRWLDQLGDAAEGELQRVDELRRQLAAAATVHAPSSWRWAADHPERAVEALERADGHRHLVTEELLPAQRFDEAGQALDRAGLELIGADALLDEVDDLVIDLERALADAPAALARAEDDVRALAAVLARYGADVEEEVRRRATDLTDTAAELAVELARPKPDHLLIVETADAVARDADDLLATAEAQHERAEAGRRERDRQIERARRALARARRSLGWQLFPSADGAALDRLEGQLGSLPSAPGAAADAAADIADEALRIQEQILARRRRRSVAAGSGPPILSGPGWTMGGSNRRSSTGGVRRRAGSRSSGGRSFGGRPRSRGGRALGSRRSSGRF